MDRPSAIVIRSAGTNCEQEMVRGFERAGADVALVHLDSLIARPSQLSTCDLIGIAGGFSYGDDVAAGRVFAVKARESLGTALKDAADRGVPMIGACNGFQVMVQAGLLPGWPAEANQIHTQTCALATNSSARFVDAWPRVRYEPESVCIWTRGLDAFNRNEDVSRLPVAHGEGRFVTASPQIMKRLESSGQIAVRYVDDVNGSESQVAGICDPTGRIFGLMPHPERYLEWSRHPYWTRLPKSLTAETAPGLRFFQNAVEAVRAVSIAR